MSVLERTIEYFSPETALRRERDRLGLDTVRNSGYSNHGASRTKKVFKGMDDSGGSAAEDVHESLSTLRVRSRELYMGAPIATGALKTYRTNVVGSGLTAKPVLDAKVLRLTEEQADELEKQISREFALWADNTACDAERMSSFYELQQLAFLSWLMNGDVFALLQRKERAGSPYQTCVLLVEADRVCTPGDWMQVEPDLEGKILGGVEVDGSGEVVAYHICKRHPMSRRTLDSGEWVRVEAYGRQTGRRNVLHLMTRERIGARRGVPMLAPVIEALLQMGRYTNAELMAAVVNAIMTVFIETEQSRDAPPFGEQIPPDETAVDEADKNSIELGSGLIVDLAPGEHANQVAPGRPNRNFDGFISAVARQIGAALELPYELLMKQFTASYSASRAALLEAWKSFSQWRDWMTEKFCQPVYEEWMAEAVALGRINAPGFFADPAVRKAWTNAQWYGPTQGQLDPVDEVEAAERRVRYGFSTRAKEAMELTGTDLWDNLRTAKRENELMREAGMGDGGPTRQSSAGQREKKTGSVTGRGVDRG